MGAEIADKMKQLEQIQSQLRQFQSRIVSQLNLSNGEQQQQVVLTQQQIQSVLSSAEQAMLARLIQQKKQCEAEVQALKHKLLAPTQSTSSASSPAPAPQTDSSTNQNQVFARLEGRGVSNVNTQFQRVESFSR